MGWVELGWVGDGAVYFLSLGRVDEPRFPTTPHLPNTPHPPMHLEALLLHAVDLRHDALLPPSLRVHIRVVFRRLRVTWGSHGGHMGDIGGRGGTARWGGGGGQGRREDRSRVRREGPGQGRERRYWRASVSAAVLAALADAHILTAAAGAASALTVVHSTCTSRALILRFRSCRSCSSCIIAAVVSLRSGIQSCSRRA